VAEKQAKMGLPEILFNLFPGMGAYSLLARKLDAARAERMILSGRLYGAQELYDLGVVDVLAEDGDGEEAVRQYIARNARRHGAHRAICEVRRRINPLVFQELEDITRIWIDTALELEEADLRKMERLATAQQRRLGFTPPVAAAAQ
jgi:DSF synthase